MSNIASKAQVLLDISWDTVQYKECDFDNIKEMLPMLYPEQQEDVYNAELRFQEGKGRMFTNGTGTGKTFVGLGIVKRFVSQGKTDIIIVVPTESKAQDWIEDAQKVEVTITMLESIRDAGQGVVVTTYANYYQNDALLDRKRDLLIYDESHYINQNSKGEDTVYFERHRKMANLPSYAKEKAMEIVGDPPEWSEDPLWGDKARAWRYQIHHYSHRIVESTKVVYLSATPFAYHKSTKYGDGSLWDVEEILHDDDFKESADGRGPSRWDSFMMSNFGYQWKNNKLQKPEVEVDTGLLEREFFEKYKEQNVISTRILELDHDYSREFIKLNSKLGDFLDQGMGIWSNDYIRRQYPYLSRVAYRKYNYQYLDQLLEAIKAKNAIPRIRQHLSLNRKVLVFHRYNNTISEHPFKFDANKLVNKDEKYLVEKIKKDIIQFEIDYPQYINLNLDNLNNARKTLQEAFPNAKQINGIISKKKNKQHEKEFNDDYSGVDILIVQERKGKEGISLHDTTGKKQRVKENLGLPITPNAAIQSEGRIYRSGVKSDAIYEYATLHTDFEKIAFSEKVSQRSRTAENLAMGNLARDLETAFKEGYINADNKEPGIYQGIGGKKKDRQFNQATDFEKAITFFFSRQKKNAKTKSFEGVDFFATPEPLGYKMVEWLKPQPGEKGLEPSVGNGAIGRWFPKHCDNKYVEPSRQLFSEMKLICDGDGLHHSFEEMSIQNKFHFIAMNPPFGKGGKTAVEHIAKAVSHMSFNKHHFEYDGSRLLAIMPCGPSADKYLDDFLNSKYFKNFNYTGEMLLPQCTFKRAGTSVMTRLIKIEHVNTGNESFRQIDLRYCEDLPHFFEAIKDLNF